MGKKEIKLLRRTLVGLQAGALPEQCRNWLLNGLLTHVQEGTDLTLALGLKPRVGRFSEVTWRAEEYVHRDTWLIYMARHLPEPTTYLKACRLSEILNATASIPFDALDYDSIGDAAAVRSLDDPRYLLNPLQCLRHMRVATPMSVSQIYRILKSAEEQLS